MLPEEETRVIIRRVIYHLPIINLEMVKRGGWRRGEQKTISSYMIAQIKQTKSCIFTDRKRSII
jgi:hypothetical protein